MATRRNRRAGIEDRWRKTVRHPDGTKETVPSANDGKGSRWKARYVDDDGNEREKLFAKKADAQRWLDTDVTAKFATGTYVAPAAGRATVDDVYRSWAASQAHIAPKTARSRRSTWESRVEQQWADVAVGDVKTAAVRAWVAAMVADEVGVPTIENAFGLLRQIMGAAVEDARVPRNPCEGVKLPKRKHADRGYLTHAQVVALAGSVDRNPEVVRFLAYTGLRWGEMAALRVQDFDMLRRRANVSRSVTESGGLVWSTPKTHERRSVPFPAALADELSALMIGRNRDDLVFTDLRGGVLRNSNWRARVFDKAVAAAQEAALAQRAKEVAASTTTTAAGTATTPEFPTITPHDLRHTAASLAVSAGANVKAVQRMLGHAKASMTLDVYADLFDEDLDGVADRLDAAIRSTTAGDLRAVSSV
ncbi:tyrosine-type recombinase/integrase [Mycolicibacterium iranicum]|uniref:tyrosine-type recombinase/integrase n=1 Tax=Mycolicibacterium iranicum TaxID=912594 RepID=UPI0004638957|nr:site-specific integrase [Mycolicibacterium iranicum]